MWKSKFHGAFVLNRRVVLHAIDATPARWRGDAGSSPLDGADTAASSPRNAPDTLVDFHTGDDDVSSLGADDNDRNKSADDRSLSNGSLEDDDRSFRSHPMAAWDSAPPFFSVGGNGPPAAAFPSHSRDDASL